MSLPADAQSTNPLSIPPDRYILSPGKVDIRSGRFDYRMTDLSVGQPDADRGIALVRTGDNGKSHLERFAQFSHNWEIFLTQTDMTLFAAGDATGSGQPAIQISITAQGRSMSFRMPKTSTGNASPVSYSPAQLSRDANGVYTYTAADGTVIVFEPLPINSSTSHCAVTPSGWCAYATSVTVPDGTRYTLSYDTTASSQERLRSVVSSAGYALLLEYTASSTKPYINKACVLNLTQVTLPASPICPVGVPTTVYTYVGDFMTGATDVLGKTWTFVNTWTSDSADYTISFFKPNHQNPYLINTYQQSTSLGEVDPNLRVVGRQQFTGGPDISYGYALIDQEGDVGITSSEPAGGSYTIAGQGTVSANYGAYMLPHSKDKAQYVTDGPETVYDELNRVTQRSYCVPYPVYGGCQLSPLQWIKTPEQDETDYSYDGVQNVTGTVHNPKPNPILADNSNLSTISTSAQYACGAIVCWTKPTKVIDARGNATNFTYDTTHGGVLTETDPADPSGIQPVKRYAYVQRYAWIKNTSGGYSHAASPVWLLSSMKTCRTSATVSGACSAGAADEVATTYEYGPDAGPNNLWLRGVAVTADGATRRTCYLYDAQGNKIAETKPRGTAALSACP